MWKKDFFLRMALENGQLSEHVTDKKKRINKATAQYSLKAHHLLCFATCHQFYTICEFECFARCLSVCVITSLLLESRTRGSTSATSPTGRP